MNALYRTTLCTLLVVLAACSASGTGSTGGATEQPAPTDAARLDVSNRSSQDMDVFAVRGSQRSRIGLAPAGETTRFTLSAGITSGGGMLHFEAVPIRAAGAPTADVRTQPVSVGRGDVITLDVPPR